MSEVLQRTRGEALRVAKRLGLVCIFPRRDELQVDLDNGELNERTLNALAGNGYTVLGRLKTTSKGGKTHIYLKLNKPVRRATAIAMQACLGSDPVREVLSLLRRLQGSVYPTALFETEEEATKVAKWRARHADDAFGDDIPF